MSLISGLFETLRIKNGASLAHLDLDPMRPRNDALEADIIARVYSLIQTRMRIAEAGLGIAGDLDFIERDGVTMIRRYEADWTFTRAVSSTLGALVPETQPFGQPGRPLKLKVGKPGLLDSIYFEDDDTVASPPKGDEVDIEVLATSLNFRDIMMAMGQIETYDLGAECSGVVTRVGPDVESIQVGDRVLAQAFGTFSTYARTSEIHVGEISLALRASTP